MIGTTFLREGEGTQDNRGVFRGNAGQNVHDDQGRELFELLQGKSAFRRIFAEN